MASKSERTRCVTVIPKDWPKMTGPEYKDGDSIAAARSAWAKHLRDIRKVTPNPKVYG